MHKICSLIIASLANYYSQAYMAWYGPSASIFSLDGHKLQNWWLTIMHYLPSSCMANICTFTVHEINVSVALFHALCYT